MGQRAGTFDGFEDLIPQLLDSSRSHVEKLLELGPERSAEILDELGLSQVRIVSQSDQTG